MITTQTAPWVLWTEQPHDPNQEAYLLGVLASIPCDWWMRQFAEGHVDEEAFNCIRVPLSGTNSKLAAKCASLAGRLAAVDDRFKDWANAVGVEHGPLKEDEMQDMIRELDAVVARLYGLNEKQLVHIFETFHEGWDYSSHLKETLCHFKAASKLQS